MRRWLSHACCSLILSLSISLGASAQWTVAPHELSAMSFEELMKVTITTAGKKQEKIRDIPASVVIITRHDIETLGYQTLEEIISSVPGFYNIDDYAHGANFGVRGFWTDTPNQNVMIMINNAKQTYYAEANHSPDKISLPVEAIDRIEVVRGPMSLLYGSSAFFGVINIFTNDAESSGSRHLVSGSLGTAERRKAFVRVAGSGEEVSFTCNMSAYTTRGLGHSLRKYGLDQDGSMDGLAEDNEKYVDLSVSTSDLDINVSYSESERELTFLFLGGDQGTQTEMTSLNAMLSYRKPVSEKVTIETRANYINDHMDFDYDVLFPEFYGNQSVPCSSFEIELRAFLTPSASHSVTAGIDYRMVLDVSSRYDLPGYQDSFLENKFITLNYGEDITTRAIYVQAENRLSERIRTVVGLRLEQMLPYRVRQEHAVFEADVYENTTTYASYDNDDISVIPRLGVVLTLSDTDYLKLLYGKAINHPSFFKVTNNAFHANGLSKAAPENIQTLEVVYMTSPLEWLTASVSLFYNDLDQLVFRTTGFDDQDEYFSYFDNEGDMVTKGAELSIQTRITSRLQTVVSATYQEITDQNDESIEVGFCPDLLLYGNAVYYPNDNTSLALTANYVDKMLSGWDPSPIDVTDPDSPPIGRFGDMVDSHLSIGVNLRFNNLIGEGSFVNFKASNLLDEDIRYPTTTNSTWAPKGTLGYGRTILVSAGWRF